MLWRVYEGWTHRLRAHTGWVTCCAFQPTGAILASGSADETLRLWNVSALIQAEDAGETVVNGRGGEGEGEGGAVGAGKTAKGKGGRVRGRGVCVQLKNYGGCIKCVAFSMSGALLGCGSGDDLVRVWRVRDRSVRV